MQTIHIHIVMVVYFIDFYTTSEFFFFFWKEECVCHFHGFCETLIHENSHIIFHYKKTLTFFKNCAFDFPINHLFDPHGISSLLALIVTKVYYRTAFADGRDSAIFRLSSLHMCWSENILLFYWRSLLTAFSIMWCVLIQL